MKKPIPGVEGGEQLICDGCGEHAGLPDENSPTGTELVTRLTTHHNVGPLFDMGDWHKTCFQFALSGGYAYQKKLQEERRARGSLSLDMPDAIGPGGVMKEHVAAEAENLMLQGEQAIAASMIGPLLKFTLWARDAKCDVDQYADRGDRMSVLQEWADSIQEAATKAIADSAEKFGLPLDCFAKLDACHAGKDGECIMIQCPQTLDGEPEKSGRHCPLDKGEDDAA